MKQGWKIGEMAELLGTTPKTLRHHESLGLLARPARSAAGYRMYDLGALARATIVIGMRRIGLSTAEIAKLIGDGVSERDLRRRLAEVLDEKIRNADEQIAVLQGRREDLSTRQRRLVLGEPRDCVCNLLSMRCVCAPARTGAQARPKR